MATITPPGASITATRRYQFAAGHRVHGHESKCANLHGHNYVAHLTARQAAPVDVAQALERIKQRGALGLDPIGRVIDFSVLKTRVGGWIDQWWDHGMILWNNDPVLELWDGAHGQLAEHKVYGLPLNPTAENMAHHLLHYVGPLVLQGTGVELCRVVLWETENCYAEVSL